MENNKKNLRQSEEFNIIHKEYSDMKKRLIKINQEKRLLEKELKKVTFKLQNNCNHVFKREETTSGCYREFNNICVLCGLWR